MIAHVIPSVSEGPGRAGGTGMEILAPTQPGPLLTLGVTCGACYTFAR